MFPVRPPTISDVIEGVKSRYFWEGLVFGAALSWVIIWYYFSVQGVEIVAKQVSQIVSLKNQEIEALKYKLDVQELSIKEEKLLELTEQLAEDNRALYLEKYDLLDMQLFDANSNVNDAVIEINFLVESGAEMSTINHQKELLEKYFLRVGKVEEQIQKLQLPNKTLQRINR